jgi:hypothetical protein
MQQATATFEPAPAPNFADIAVELRIAERSFAELSFAAAILSVMRADNLYRLERVANEIGLDSGVARKIILDEQRCAALIAEAHRLFKAMIPHEDRITAIIAGGHGA